MKHLCSQLQLSPEQLLGTPGTGLFHLFHLVQGFFTLFSPLPSGFAPMLCALHFCWWWWFCFFACLFLTAELLGDMG